MNRFNSSGVESTSHKKSSLKAHNVPSGRIFLSMFFEAASLAASSHLILRFLKATECPISVHISEKCGFSDLGTSVVH